MEANYGRVNLLIVGSMLELRLKFKIMGEKNGRVRFSAFYL